MRRAYMVPIIVIILFIISLLIGVFTYFESLNIAPKQERKIIPLELKVIDPQALTQDSSNEAAAQ